jgi:hypothetical protein
MSKLLWSLNVIAGGFTALVKPMFKNKMSESTIAV